MKLLIHRKEHIYFAISLLVTIGIYVGVAMNEALWPMLVYVPMIAFTVFITQGLMIGNIKGNGVKITSTQFPEIHDAVLRLSHNMGMKSAPEVYMIQSGGALNAFATRFLNVNFVVLYSDLMEIAFEKGMPAVEFVIAHELAHLKRAHTTKRLLVLPSIFIPFLGQAYSRACEYTSDRMGAHLVPEGAEQGLLVLAAGKHLHKHIDVHSLIRQQENELGFWGWYAEILSSHPFLVKRIKHVKFEMPKSHMESTVTQSAL